MNSCLPPSVRNAAAVVVALLMCAGRMGAQGTVNFQNLTVGVPLPLNAVTGLPMPAGSVLVQLYYGAAGSLESELVPVDSPPIVAVQGHFSGSTRVLSAAVVGDCMPNAQIQATVQVRFWETALGPTYGAACSAVGGAGGGEYIGYSNPITLTTGNPCAMPPSVPVNLVGLTRFQFGCVPEPSTWALAVVGGSALWVGLRCRRRG